MNTHADRSMKALGLAVLIGVGLALVLLLGLPRLGQAVARQGSGTGASAKEHSTLTFANLITSTSSYTYYFPIVLNNCALPQWTFLGLHEVPVKQIALSGSDPETIYVVPDHRFGYTSTGLYKSDDGGSTWIPSADGISGQIQSIFVHPVTSTMLLAGTLMGDGVYYSYDSGEHWTPSPMYPFVRAVAAQPTPPTLWLAASHNPLIFGAAYIHRSEDAGATWHTATPEGLIVNTFVSDPDNLNRVYACAQTGIECSDDMGLTWSHCALSSCHELTVHPHTGTILYAATMDGVFKTEDRGMNWTDMLTVEQGQYTHIEAVEVDPIHPVTVYAATLDALFRSTDAGNSWRQVNLPAQAGFLYIRDLTVSRSGVLYVGTDNGVWAISFD